MKDSLDKYWDNIHKEYISTYDGWFNKYINLLHRGFTNDKRKKRSTK